MCYVKRRFSSGVLWVCRGRAAPCMSGCRLVRGVLRKASFFQWRPLGLWGHAAPPMLTVFSPGTPAGKPPGLIDPRGLSARGVASGGVSELRE